jgi:hypothetical protein
MTLDRSVLSGSRPRGRWLRRTGVATLGGAALVLSVLLAPAAQSASQPQAKTGKAAPTSDVREVNPNKKLSTKGLNLDKLRKAQAKAAAAGTPAVGTTRNLLAEDDFNGRLYLKPYTLQAVGPHIEVWVANDTSFPAGDCRNAVANTTTVTPEQAQYLADQFETKMFPVESQAFSVAPDRDGSNNQIASIDPTGDGDKIMTLVDNVRDDNYFLGVNTAPTYIAGFFSSQFNELLDRNIMTIDAFDWLHRTGANPPDEPTADLCTSRPSRPFTYEGTFAHEYQHLLQYYQDPAEVSWVNEGLSDFAISLTGYGDATRTVFQSGTQSHIYCFQGFGTVQTPFNQNPRDCGGPENSLTLWGDQFTGNSILADYGNAWSFMLFLKDRYGVAFMSALHRDGNAQGLEGVQDQLDQFAPGTDVFSVIHDFQTATLVDGIVGAKNGSVKGIAKGRVTSPSLNSTVNLDSPASYAAAGAPANGADYVALRDGSGQILNAKGLKSLSFQGADTLVPEALKWTSVADPPDHTANAAIWSGNTSNLDASAVTQVTVPTANPTLTYSELHLAEATFDYAYTVISTDGGVTYTALANANTVAGPQGPALNGDGEWGTQTFDLSAYAGQQVLIGFRYVSDGGVNEGGWYVDDVNVGGTVINDGTTTTPFSSTTQIRPVPVHAWNVRVVGVDTAKHKVLVKNFSKASFSMGTSALAPFRAYPQVVVLVAYDEPTEQYQPQALYTLTANGVVQPGGGLAAPTAG